MAELVDFHLLKWNVVKLPLLEGGLGIIDLKKEQEITCKMDLAFQRKEALWRKTIATKYGTKNFMD